MKVLITGGLGFIGHNLGPYLVKRGHTVVSVDSFYYDVTDERYNDFLSERIRIIKENDIHMESADVRNTKTILSLLHLHQPDTVIHLAATANAGLCNSNPREGVDMGLMSFYGVLSALKDYEKPVHLVYSSSSMVYGEFKEPVVDETDATDPINVYGASKLSCEIFLKSYGRVYNIPWTIVRPSALYGQRCINRRVTQLFIENILDTGKIKLAGCGEFSLDFTDVRDLCQGFALTIEHLEKSRNKIFNVTYGQARRIKDLIPILQSELGDFICEDTPIDPTVPKRGTLSTDKIKNLLDYQPEYPIDVGYRDMVNWYKSIQWGKAK